MATCERAEDGGVAVGESVGVEVGTAVGVAEGGGVAVGAEVAVGAGVTVEVAVDAAVGALVGVSAGVKVPMGGCALGPVVEGGGGTVAGLVGEQAVASSPAAKPLRARRKLRREMGLTTGERST